MRHLYKSVLLCDLSDEEIEKIRAQFVDLLGLDEQEYKAVTADYSHLISTNTFFAENRKVTLSLLYLKKSLIGMTLTTFYFNNFVYPRMFSAKMLNSANEQIRISYQENGLPIRGKYDPDEIGRY